MTLPVSGNPIKMSQVDVELGNSSTAQLNLGASSVRTLFGVASGQIKMSDGFGKTNGPAGVVASIDLQNSRYNYYQLLTMPTFTWSSGTQYTSISSAALSFGGTGYLQCVNEGPSGSALLMFVNSNGSNPELRSLLLTNNGGSYSVSGAIYTGGTFPNLTVIPQSIAYGNSIWVAYTRLGSGWQHVTSSDGVNWSLTSSGLGTGTLNMIVWAGTEFLGHNSNNGSSTVYASTNGTSWSSRGGISLSGSGGSIGAGCAYGNGVYMVASADNGSPGKIYVHRSTNNGASFSSTTLSPGIPTNTNGRAQLRYCGGNNWAMWCGGGSFDGVSYYSSDNGVNWSSPNLSTWVGDQYAPNVRMLGKGSTVIVPVSSTSIRASIDSGVTWKTYSAGASQNIPQIYFQ